MPSKELIDRCIVAADKSGYEKDPTAAVEIIVRATAATILAALQEPNEAMIDAAVSAWNRRMEARALGGTLLFGGNPQETMSANWRAMLAASALGEQSE